MLKSFYLNKIVYYIAGAAAILFALSYFSPNLFRFGQLVLLLLGIAIIIDTLLVYSKRKGINANRSVTDRFSIGDPNKVELEITNHYPFPARVSVIDELPVQFQERKWVKRARIPGNSKLLIDYSLRPKTRGEYVFNDINVYVHAPLQLVKRRYSFSAQHTVKVYPSYIQMRR